MLKEPVIDPADRRHSLDAIAMVLLVILCGSWGLNQVAIKIANQGISPLLQCGIRSGGASILVFFWMTAHREPIVEKDGTLWWGISAGFLFTIEFLLIYWGLDYTLASRSCIFLYLSPFVVALGAQLFIPGENLSSVQIIGLCCAFIGILLAFRESLHFPSMKMLIGDSMLIGAALLWGATTVLIKASPLIRVKPSKTLLYQLVVSAAVLPVASWLKDEPGIIFLTPWIVSSILYQTIWVAFVTYLAWFWLLRHYPPSQLASFTFLTPLLGVLAGHFLLNEPISSMLIISLVLVGVGIYLVNR
jgi:drug/metabolite transporter (DMT)-like permease